MGGAKIKRQTKNIWENPWSETHARGCGHGGAGRTTTMVAVTTAGLHAVHRQTRPERNQTRDSSASVVLAEISLTRSGVGSNARKKDGVREISTARATARDSQNGSGEQGQGRGHLSRVYRTPIEDSSKEPFFMEDEVPEVLCVSKCAQLEGG